MGDKYTTPSQITLDMKNSIIELKKNTAQNELQASMFLDQNCRELDNAVSPNLRALVDHLNDDVAGVPI
jgi:hypothetical protein